MVKVGIDYQRVEARVDGVAYTLTKLDWIIYAALWEARGAFVTAVVLSLKAGIGLDMVPWHISQIRGQIGKEAIVRHDRKWPGWRMNIPLTDSGMDFDYREGG